MVWKKYYFYQTKGSGHFIMKVKLSFPKTTESKLNGIVWRVTSLSKLKIFNLELLTHSAEATVYLAAVSTVHDNSKRQLYGEI